METEIKSQLITLLQDYRDFNCSPISAQPIPTPVEFAKQVSKGYPCIYQAYTKENDENGNLNATIDPSLLDFPACRWTKQDLLALIDEKVEVAVTPTGRADDIHCIDGQDEPVFLEPATLDMTIEELLEKLCPPSTSPRPDTPTGPVYYLQSQNSNLTTTPLRRILKHIPENFPFAEPVLSTPEAINIWIGTPHSTTSTHRDPYENLYLVLKGTKTFTLYPPLDEITLPTRLVRTGRYIYDAATGTFSTVLDEAESGDASDGVIPRIPWVTVDPIWEQGDGTGQLTKGERELYGFSSPTSVTVQEGQILYLPSGWYHHVRQECGLWDGNGEVAPCIAVNYWFDMEYEGEKYVMRQLVGRLKGLMAGGESR